MKRISAVGLTIALFGLSCNNNAPDVVKGADTINNHRIDSYNVKKSVTDSTTAAPSKADAAFMVKAFSVGMLQDSLGQLAQHNASSAGVKDFGAYMMHDHTLGDQQIRQLALAKHIILPSTISNDQKKELDDLTRKTGADFDKAYMKRMITDDRDNITDFQKASTNAYDSDIRDFARKTIFKLEQHLDTAQVLSKSLR